MPGSVSLAMRIQAFSKLSKALSRVATALGGSHQSGLPHAAERALFIAAQEAEKANPWFTRCEIARALDAVSVMINEKALLRWSALYQELQQETVATKTIAVIMAGNIPLVGFHDFLSVVISGHRFLGKLSSQDALLPFALAELLVAIEPGLKSQIAFTRELITEADAIIATGSDNTARYFEYYFGGKPHIIRKNRNSSAVLTGYETEDQLKKLGEDVFAYYGLGCRSVSHLFVPKDFNFSSLADAWQPFNYLLLNKKYTNNLKYQKALYEVSGIPFTHNGQCILTKNPGLASPLSVIHYTQYQSITEAEKNIHLHANSIQCVVADNNLLTNDIPVVPFGKSQHPQLDDYADGLDTIRFLLSLR